MSTRLVGDAAAALAAEAEDAENDKTELIEAPMEYFVPTLELWLAGNAEPVPIVDIEDETPVVKEATKVEDETGDIPMFPNVEEPSVDDCENSADDKAKELVISVDGLGEFEGIEEPTVDEGGVIEDLGAQRTCADTQF